MFTNSEKEIMVDLRIKIVINLTAIMVNSQLKKFAIVLGLCPLALMETKLRWAGAYIPIYLYVKEPLHGIG